MVIRPLSSCIRLIIITLQEWQSFESKPTGLEKVDVRIRWELRLSSVQAVKDQLS